MSEVTDINYRPLCPLSYFSPIISLRLYCSSNPFTQLVLLLLRVSTALHCLRADTFQFYYFIFHTYVRRIFSLSLFPVHLFHTQTVTHKRAFTLGKFISQQIFNKFVKKWRTVSWHSVFLLCCSLGVELKVTMLFAKNTDNRDKNTVTRSACLDWITNKSTLILHAHHNSLPHTVLLARLSNSCLFLTADYATQFHHDWRSWV